MTSNSKRILEIEQQIAQLQWQRKQNDRLIQQGLESTKSLKQKDSVIQISVNNLSEKALWQNSVINDEFSRPLVLSDQQMNEFLKYERITKEKLQKYYETHHSAVVKLKHVVSNRSDAHKPDRKNQIKKLSQVETGIKKTLENLKEEKPIIHSKFNGNKGSFEFDKFIN